MPSTSQAAVTARALGILSLMTPVMMVTDAAEAQPATVRLSGTVRDFQSTHPDFGVVPSSGFGHYAGNLAFNLDAAYQPTHDGVGFKVIDQWTDSATNNIPPHLYLGAPGELLVGNAPAIDNNAVLDTWDSSLGAYGGGNVGPAPDTVTGVIIPPIVPPSGMGPSVGAVLYDGAGSTVLSSNLHCDSLSIRDLHVLQIDGNITILCDGPFDMRDGSVIELLAGATLDLYVGGDILIQDATLNAGTYDPSRFVIHHMGTGEIRIADPAEIYSTIISPEGTLVIPDEAHVYGYVMVQNLILGDNAGLHIDTNPRADVCGNDIDDTAGTAVGPDTGAITSADTFDEWFKDTMGSNVSMAHTITLTDNGTGVYEYLDNAFFPIDGRGFGDEGSNHNYYFTFDITSTFTYTTCASQFFEFEGADDAWLFIDGRLALDLGGVLPVTPQRVPIDRLGLADGQTYSLRFLYAQRQGMQAMFRMRTNLPLTDSPVPVLSAGFD